MVRYKAGVDGSRLLPVMYLAISRLDRIFQKYEHNFIITSTYDGYHNKRSLHWHGLAIDIRNNHISPAISEALYVELEAELKMLDNRFQMIVEKDHIHVEFDRRINQ